MEPPVAKPGGDDSGTDTDDEGRLIQQAAASAKTRGPAPRGPGASRIAPSPGGPAGAKPVVPRPPPAPPAPAPARPPPAPKGKGKAPPKRPAGAITMRTLLDAGFLMPGQQVLYVEYKGNITWADLTDEGTIVCNGQSFESPSAFSISVKRKLNPERKADDGWKAVKYAGKLLEHYKDQYLRQQLAASGLGGGLRGSTPSASVGTGVSPLSSARGSPSRNGEEDGPPNKRQRMEDDGGKGGLKIKLKLKDGPGSPGGARPAGPLMPLPGAASLPPLELGAYSGTPGSGEEGAQPFSLHVSEMVMIVMDFHAHCCCAEVGGLLGGTWDEATRQVTITRAFPVLEAPPLPGALPAAAAGQRPAAAVDFEPADLARVTEVVRKWGLQVVGSYRSHPAYSSAPNAVDVLTQVAAQAAARTALSGAEPNVCAVLAPYEPSLAGVSSSITWFNVEYDKSSPPPPPPSAAEAAASPPALPEGVRPMALAVEIGSPEDALSTLSMDIMNLVSTQFQHTAKTYGMRHTRVPLALPWRPASAPVPPGARPGESCCERLVASVVSRLPDVFEGDMRITYGNMVRDMVQHEFALGTRGGSGVRGAARVSDDGGVVGGRRGRGRNGASFDEFASEEETEEEELDVQLDDDDEYDVGAESD
ncbi:hypothetical protein HYH03_004886 [Edaphochlamys debaryana]|uniref:RAMA domain-containing protein n=1 Tax=Edaphochlamys debaryana TaxID=47281 RepID=A0A835Y9M6_9CHLO|nr:hypothetical protein HYH03_004886 [Edaphochlamys debaryana]|eukprot:KAG2497303.1 hypothetical protein HYH03_004886 [Edaphochlamys debaryana]